MERTSIRTGSVKRRVIESPNNRCPRFSAETDDGRHKTSPDDLYPGRFQEVFSKKPNCLPGRGSASLNVFLASDPSPPWFTSNPVTALVSRLSAGGPPRRPVLFSAFAIGSEKANSCSLRSLIGIRSWRRRAAATPSSDRFAAQNDVPAVRTYLKTNLFRIVGGAPAGRRSSMGPSAYPTRTAVWPKIIPSCGTPRSSGALL